MPQTKQILYSLPYGKTEVDFYLPGNIRLLELPDQEKHISVTLFRRRIEAELTKKNHDLSVVALVVADKTRLCEYSTYLPVLLEVLEKHGAKKESITIYIAYGNHQEQSDDECLSSYGKAFQGYRWAHHNSRDITLFKKLGTSKRGTPVLVRRDLAQSSCIITFGAISHHYFAGYGGGRKLLFPGLGEQSAIYHNHGLFLDHTHQALHKNCRLGNLDDNPLAEDLIEVYNSCPAQVEIHALMDKNGGVCDLLIGQGYDFFKEACVLHDKINEIHASEKFDLVLASCGGSPKDINIIQIHKAIHNAALWVKDGGQLILLAQCPDGVGSPTFLPWFDLGGRKKAFIKLAAEYSGNGGTALSLMEKAARISIAMCTELDQEICRKIGLEKIEVAEARKRVADSRHSALISNASLLVRRSSRP